LQPPPDTDFVAVFRDEGDTGPLADWFAAFFHPDCEFVGHGL
jgi:ketosteroid isomerase-like protein